MLEFDLGGTFITTRNIQNALEARNTQFFIEWLKILRLANIRLDDTLIKLIKDDDTLIKLIQALRETQFSRLKRENIIEAFNTQDTLHQMRLILDKFYQPKGNNGGYIDKSRPGFQKNSFFALAHQSENQMDNREIRDTAQEFLQCVVQRKLLKVNEILTNNVEALFAVGEVRDDSTRIFQAISAIAYAFWAKDGDLAEVLMNAVLINPDLSREYKEQIVVFMLEEIRRVENEGIYYQLGDETFLEHHYDFPLFLNTLLNYTKSQDWNIDQMEIYWRQGIGRQQFLLPRWVVEGYYGRLNYQNTGIQRLDHHYYVNWARQWENWWSIAPNRTLGIDFAVTCEDGLIAKAEKMWAWGEDVLAEHDGIKSLYLSQMNKLERVKGTLVAYSYENTTDPTPPSLLP